MKRQPIILLVVTCIVFCINKATAEDKDTIRVLSYNIHHGAGTDRKLDLERIAKVIKSVSPDVVSLQEVDNKVGRSRNVDQAKELAKLTGMEHVFGPSIKLGKGRYGNAVLTKLPVTKSKVTPLPGREKRSALSVTLKISNKDSAGEFLFIATHLDLNKKSQIDSVPLIEKLFDSNNNLPAILAGDLNAGPKSQTMMAFEKNWKSATSNKGLYTYPAKNPKAQIDYILYRQERDFKVLETRVLGEAVASDHRPILTVFRIGSAFRKKK